MRLTIKVNQYIYRVHFGPRWKDLTAVWPPSAQHSSVSPKGSSERKERPRLARLIGTTRTRTGQAATIARNGKQPPKEKMLRLNRKKQECT